MRFEVRLEKWRLRKPFVIARNTMFELSLVHLTIEADGITGVSEAAGVDYHGETVEGVAAAISAYLDRRDSVPDRRALLDDLPPGGARNAIDCAIWDWQAKRDDIPASDSAGLANMRSLITAYTLGIGAPDDMANAAALYDGPLLKLKLGGRDGQDVARVRAVRDAAPEARLIVDVNEGWTFAELTASAPMLADLGVELIEQPLPADQDGALAGYRSPVPLCADESVNTIADLPRLGAYSILNIKLDKTGGLTAALALAEAAKSRGHRLFVGSMVGTSLGMAPAFIIGQHCDYVDLDGPLLLDDDRAPAMRYADGVVHPYDRALWG